MYSCHSIRECYGLFSGVKLSIRSVLFYLSSWFTEKNLSFSLQCCCCCYISIFQLRTVTGFTGKAGFTCPDTDKKNVAFWNCKSSCKNRADSLAFSRVLKLITAILRLRMLHTQH